MNRTIFSLLVLLLLGLFSQPSTAQSRQQLSQQQAEENVAKMSEAEMRAYLPQAKERLKKYQSALKTGNYGVGDDAISQGVAKAAAEAFYYYYTAAINAIKKRLSKIDSQKPKPQTEQPQAETEQQQPEIPDQNLEEQRQTQANLQQSYNQYKEKSQPIYNQHHKNVDANAATARNGSVALDLVTSNKDPNFKPITANMMAEPLSPTSVPKLGDISSKFNKKQSEEAKKEEPKAPQKEESKEDEIRRLIMEIQNDINNF